MGREVVGWAMDTPQTVATAVSTLDMDLKTRRAVGVVFRPNPGSRSAGLASSRRCEQAGVLQPMRATANCCDRFAPTQGVGYRRPSAVASSCVSVSADPTRLPVAPVECRRNGLLRYTHRLSTSMTRNRCGRPAKYPDHRECRTSSAPQCA